MSVALKVWNGSSREVLDEIEAVHATGLGSRMLTRQVNYAYATLIVAHFQQYCRALHAEVAEAIVASVPNQDLAAALEVLLEERLLLDRGNPTPGSLGSDFGRFGFKFWGVLTEVDLLNEDRKARLAQLCEWRNAVVHGDIARKGAAGQLIPQRLTLKTCRDWRRSLGALARSMDRVLSVHLQTLGCPESW